MGAECSLLIKNRLKTDKIQESFSQPPANGHGTPGCRSLFDATVKFRVCMRPEDLARAGLDEIGRKLA